MNELHLDTAEEFEQYFEGREVDFMDEMLMDEIDAECEAVEDTMSEFEVELANLEMQDMLATVKHEFRALRIWV